MAYMCSKMTFNPESPAVRVITDITLEEYMENMGDEYQEGNRWDFSIEDVKSGAIELDTSIVYCLIGDRLYEWY